MTWSRVIATLCMAQVLCGFTLFRDPASSNPLRWAGTSISITIHEAGTDDISSSDGSDLLAIRSALAAWSHIPDTTFHFIDAGLTTSRSLGCDGVNRIAFRESWSYASGVLAFTDHCRSGATLLEADIMLNGQTRAWTTDGSFYRGTTAMYDVQAVVTHELGHVIGLHHSAQPQATMYFASSRGMTHPRTLHPDDHNAVRFLYPSQASTCSDDLECPLLAPVFGPSSGVSGGGVRMRCNGACVGGAAPYGGACYGGADCDSGQCMRVAGTYGTGSDPGFCTESCSAGTCAAGSFCDTGKCVLGTDDCTPNGDSSACVGSNVVCTRDIDGRTRCNKLCYAANHCSTIPGSECWGGVDATHSGFCLVPGQGTEGTCNDPFDCASLVCTTTLNGQNSCAWQEPPTPTDGGPTGGDAATGPSGGDTFVAAGDTGESQQYSGDDYRAPGDAPHITARPRDAAEPITGGCGCDMQSPTSPSRHILFVVAMVLFVVRRRRS